MADDPPPGDLPSRILGLRWAALRYVAVGATLNLASIFIFGALWSAAPMIEPVLINVITSCLLFPIWYALNRRWVFRSESRLGPEVRRAITTYLSAMLISALLIWSLTSIWNLAPVFAQVITVGLIVVAGFLINGLWTFTHKAPPASDSPA